MNSFGRIFRISIYGESHGKGVGVVVDGIPPGIKIEANDFAADLDRRKGGKTGTTERIESDIPEFISGIFNLRTTGTPLNIFFPNKNVRPEDYENIRDIPRPGHADFTALKKFGGFNDHRGGGHFSGRLTVGLVAAGIVAKKILSGMNFKADVVEIGGEKDIKKGLEKISGTGDSTGGIVECRINGIPVGLGEPFFDSAESLLSHLVFSIPGIKGIEFGSGFRSASMRGSEHNDKLIDKNGKTSTNNDGGINGGITNGNELVFRVAVKPASSIFLKQKTVNISTGNIEELKLEGRHDSCVALRVPVILEAAAAIVLTDLHLLRQKQVP